MTDASNRLLWSNVLDGAWLQKHFANRIETITVLPLVIRFYLAVLDGECQVERDLGALLAESSEHANLQVDGIDDLLMIKGSGLQGSADFGNVGTGTIAPLTKSCLELWRSVYGCRFGSYDAKPRVQIRDKKRTAFAHLRREVLAAAHSTTILPRTAVPFPNMLAVHRPWWTLSGFGCLGFVHTSTANSCEPPRRRCELPRLQCESGVAGKIHILPRSLSMPLHLCLHWESLRRWPW